MDTKEIEVSTQLTIRDVQLMKAIIENCSVRGVFRANELTVVGNLYDKLSSTVTSLESNENRA